VLPISREGRGGKFTWLHRSTGSSEISISNEFSVVTRKESAMIFCF
jgi:hypothetical protein